MSQASLDEVNRILHTSRDVKSFYQHFLALSASMSGAQVGVAWRGKSVPFQPICQVKVQDSNIAQLSITEQRHNELLKRSADSEKAFIVVPAEESASDPPLLFGAIHRPDHTEVVELVLPIGHDKSRHEEIVRRLDEFCAVAARFREPNRDADSVADAGPKALVSRPLTADLLDQYVHQIHSSIDDKVTMSNVANETRRLLDCDRVSVLVCKGNTFRMESISGQPSVNRRSNAVKLLTNLATATLRTGQQFWYPDESEAKHLPSQIKRPLSGYLSVAATRSMVVLPIRDRLLEVVEADSMMAGAGKVDAKVIAGIVIEHCNEQWDRGSVGPVIDIAAKHAGDAIRNSLHHRNLFLYPVWRLLGKSRTVTAARNLPKTLAVLAALTLLTLALCLIPTDFSLTCDGVLIPRERARVFAEVTGKVDQISVAHGDHVTMGQWLVLLRNDDAAIELETVLAEIEQQRQRLEENKTLRAVDRDSIRNGSVEDSLLTIEAMLEMLNRKKEILHQKMQRLNVKSPINGQVITWEVGQRLKDRPVSPGDMLMEVVSIEGDWQLELQLADRRAGHLLEAMEALQNQADSADESDAGLRVSYLLEAEPRKTYFGAVREVSQSSQLTVDQQQSMRVTVDVDEADIKHLKHVRTGVTAKIYCGRRSLGYVWFHDIWEFIQSKVLFRLW